MYWDQMLHWDDLNIVVSSPLKNKLKHFFCCLFWLNIFSKMGGLFLYLICIVDPKLLISFRKSSKVAPRSQLLFLRTGHCFYTLLKKKCIFSSYIRIFKGSGAKSYMRNGFLIYEEMCKYLVIYEEAVTHLR
jgi:hypothetical protein